MGFELRVSLTDLKRAFRRLLARLPDEMEAGGNFIFFSAMADCLNIVVGGTSEVVNATGVHPGQTRIPCPVFRGIARTLRFYRGTIVTVVPSKGLVRIVQTEFRHPNISVSSNL